MQRMEVYYLMAHLIITLAILGAYIYSTSLGLADETLKNLLLIIGGYWFGAMGANKVFKKKGEPKSDE